MTLWRIAAAAAGVVALAAFAWPAVLIFQATGGPPVVVDLASPPSAAPTAHINATIFFGATKSGGSGLVATRVEVPLATTVAAQGEAIPFKAVLADPPAGVVRVVPAGTRLRAFYVDGRGDAFLDLSSEVRSAHPAARSARR